MWTRTRNLLGNILCANTLSPTEISGSNNSQIRWCAGMKYGYLPDDNTFPYFKTRKANAQYNIQTSNSEMLPLFILLLEGGFNLNVTFAKRYIPV